MIHDPCFSNKYECTSGTRFNGNFLPEMQILTRCQGLQRRKNSKEQQLERLHPIPHPNSKIQACQIDFQTYFVFQKSK